MRYSFPDSYTEALRLVADLHEKIEKDTPKVEAYDQFLNGENYHSMNEVAKILGFGRNTLFRLLRHYRILMSNNNPYQRYIQRGYFVVKEKTIVKKGKVINISQTFATAKGIVYIDDLITKKSDAPTSDRFKNHFL